MAIRGKRRMLHTRAIVNLRIQMVGIQQYSQTTEKFTFTPFSPVAAITLRVSNCNAVTA
jgi:hypothetical protein